jgi:hypothetical protein
MSTIRRSLFIPAVTLAITLVGVTSGCSSDAKSSSTSSSTATTEITITVGKDSSPDRIEQIKLGSKVKLTIVDPSADQEYHVHGYELGDGVEMTKGTPEVFEFVADKAGDFEVESHKTETVLVILHVS